MMRYKADQKEQTRSNIVSAAGRCFKKGGFSGVGVDGLAKEAGVTSGAFYGHFESKAAAFSAAVIAEMEGVMSGIATFQQEYGDKWWQEFAKFYMGQKRTCDLTEGCVLQTLTPEVGRSDESMRALFETELLKIVTLATNGTSQLTGQNNTDKTWANFAMLIGGVTLARAVADKNLSDEIANVIQNALIATKS